MATNSRTITSEEQGKLMASLAKSRVFLGKHLLHLSWLWIWAIFLSVIAWAIISWFGRLLFQVDFGWHSQYWTPIFSSIVLLSTVLIGPVMTKEVRRQPSLRRALKEDLEDGVVTEEAFHFTEAKRLQEREHGGLIYFLRTVDNRVYVLFDYESQDLGVDEQDPLTSTFRPHEEFVMARALKSRMILSKRFFGRPLELLTPVPITVPPSKWPAFEAYCDTPWEQLETKFCRPTTGSRRRRR